MPLDAFVAAFPTAPVLQADDRIVVDCPPSAVWRSLEQPALPRWAPVVRGVVAGAGPNRVGRERVWRLGLGHRAGRAVERCVGAVPDRRLVYAIEPGAGSLQPYLRRLVFAFDLRDLPSGQTEVRLRTYYPAGGALDRLLRRAVVRRRFAALRRVSLRNAKQVAERAHRERFAVPALMPAGAVVPPAALLLERH